MKRHSRSGFTLVEVLIYIVMLAAVVFSTVLVFYQIVRSYNHNRSIVEVEEEANFVMRKIAWTLAGASTVNVPAPNTNSSTLSVDKFNYPGNPIVVGRESGNATIKKGTGEPAVLNSQNVSIANLLFEHFPSSTASPESVGITLTVVSRIADTTVSNSTTLTSTVYLRK